MKKIVGIGAEAVLYKVDGHLVKERVSKSYRLPEIDNKIRKLRTRSERRLLERAYEVINVPKVLDHCDSAITVDMEFVSGLKLSSSLDSLKNRKEICVKIGSQVAKLHDNGIIHGDLTTSNMILKDKKVFFVDFGLGFMSDKIEDMAVDLHLLKQALESKHYLHYEESFKAVLRGYKKCKKFDEVLSRLDKVERRGRYKGKKFQK